MAHRSPSPKSQDFEPIAPRLTRNTIESTFEVSRNFRCTMRSSAASSTPAG